MKKIFFMAAAATAMFAACNKTELVPTGDAQEISFVAVNKVATKTPVDGVKFQDGDNMAVAAYIVDGTTPANFFGYTLFNKKDDLIWSGVPARYWPLTTSTINFLAVTEVGGGVDNTTVSFNDESPASGATVTLAGNNVNNQNDLMFAAGTGKHAQGAAYTAVPMNFKHALSWINFNVKTATPNYNKETNQGCTIRVNSITLNSAVFDGILTLENTQCWTDRENATESVNATWITADPTNLAVPKAKGETTADGVVLTDQFQLFGNGLLVVPDGYAGSFTINYTLTQSDNTANTFDYTYNLPAGTWQMAKKYFYNINITLSEIQVTPSITDWDETSTSTDVTLNGESDNQQPTPAPAPGE